MKFKEIKESPELIEQILEIYNNPEFTFPQRIKMLQEKFNVKSERTIRMWLVKLKINRGSQEYKDPEQLIKAKEKQHLKKECYFVTWCQNNTPIHDKMLKGMKAYSKFHDAEILVIAGQYTNPNSLAANKHLKNKEKSGDISWDSNVDEYLDANRHQIHKYVKVMSDIRIQPTAYNPLSGLEGLSNLESSIFGHPKQALRSLPILDGMPHKVLASTGAISLPNYTDTKAGNKGKFDHVLGFLIIEVKDNDVFLIRNVIVDEKTGEFNDLYYNIKDGEITTNKSCDVFHCGDIHLRQESQKTLSSAYELMDILKPNHIVLPDLFDGLSISHHHDKSPFLQVKKQENGLNSLEKEIEYLMDFLHNLTNKYPDSKILIQPSNHNDFVDRWLNDKDWKKDISNAKIYNHLSNIILNNKVPKGIISYLIEEEFSGNPNIICTHRNDSYMVNGIEHNIHGDKGASGSRGSSVQFRKLPVKSTTDHTHSPAINGGHFNTGTFTKLRQEYNEGLSSWMNAGVLQDELGKRQIIIFINGEYTTFKKVK